MPTMTPSSLDGMIAVSKDSKVKPLGYICWFSVPDETVGLRRVKRIWGLSGLPTEVLPKDQRAVNAFKRAVREQERLGTFTEPGSMVRTETDVRDVVETEEDVVYQISRVVRDRNEREVDYPKALRVWFNKQTEDMSFKPLGGVSRADVLPIMESIQALFDANAKSITGAKVRTLVRQYIKDDDDEGTGMVGLSGENLRGKAGGVYFVLAKHAEKLEGIAEFLNELYEPHGRAYLYTVPLADSKSEREMIRAAHSANLLAEMESAMSGAAALLREGRDRSIRTNVAQHHWNRLQRFKRRAAEYATALREEQDDVTEHLRLLHKQLDKLV
jgi:hypothetical protein